MKAFSGGNILTNLPTNAWSFMCWMISLILNDPICNPGTWVVQGTYFPGLCNISVLTPLYWIACDVNSINKSWCGAQGKGPTMDLVFYVSVIKIAADSLCASQAQYVLRHHVTMQLIKIPQLAMHRNVKEMGAWFHKEYGGGNNQTLEPMRKTHQVVNHPLCPFVPSH